MIALAVSIGLAFNPDVLGLKIPLLPSSAVAVFVIIIARGTSLLEKEFIDCFQKLLSLLFDWAAATYIRQQAVD